MPFYDYKCSSCGITFEIRKGMNETLSPRCPKCRAESRQVFYAPRTMRSNAEDASSSCSSCSSGVCSSCGANN